VAEDGVVTDVVELAAFANANMAAKIRTATMMMDENFVFAMLSY